MSHVRTRLTLDFVLRAFATSPLIAISEEESLSLD